MRQVLFRDDFPDVPKGTAGFSDPWTLLNSYDLFENDVYEKLTRPYPLFSDDWIRTTEKSFKFLPNASKIKF